MFILVFPWNSEFSIRCVNDIVMINKGPTRVRLEPLKFSVSPSSIF
jgi:hypothetical protein